MFDVDERERANHVWFLQQRCVEFSDFCFFSHGEGRELLRRRETMRERGKKKRANERKIGASRMRDPTNAKMQRHICARIRAQEMCFDAKCDGRVCSSLSRSLFSARRRRSKIEDVWGDGPRNGVLICFFTQIGLSFVLSFTQRPKLTFISFISLSATRLKYRQPI